jgi:hypothetical protein
MHKITNIKDKHYYLFSIEQDEVIGTFHNYNHVLAYLRNSDLTSLLAHNKNDCNTHIYYTWDYGEKRKLHKELRTTNKTYIILDSALTVVHKDLLAKDIESYQEVKKASHRALKRGTNKNRSYHGFRHNTRHNKNVIAYLISEKEQFPLNKRQLNLYRRCWDWDAGRRSNQGSSWKIQKKKSQWDKKC